MQRRIERALLHLQYFARYLLDALRDGLAVHRSEGDGFQNQKVEGSLNEVTWFSHAMIIYNIKCRLSGYQRIWRPI